MYGGLQVPQSLLPGRLHVLVVVPAVGLGQPGLQLGQVVREEVAGVRDQAGQARGHLLAVLQDGQAPVVGGQPLLDLGQAEHPQGGHVVPTEALSGLQAGVSQVTVDHDHLGVGVLQLLCDPGLRAGHQVLLDHLVLQVDDAVAEVSQPAAHQLVDGHELLGVREVEEEDRRVLRGREGLEQTITGGLGEVRRAAPADNSVEEEDGQSQDQGRGQAGSRHQGEVRGSVGAGRGGGAALTGDVDRFVPQSRPADLCVTVYRGVRARVTVGMVH